MSFRTANIGAFLEDWTHRAMLQYADAVVEDARSRISKDSGEMANSIMVVDNGRDGVSVVVADPGAASLEYGARPHVILPRNSPVLVFELQGRTVFATRVLHPGNKPKPFLSPAVRKCRKKLGIFAKILCPELLVHYGFKVDKHG